MAGGVTGRKVSYPYFKAFNQLLGNLDILGQVMDNAVSANKGGSVTQGEYREGKGHSEGKGQGELQGG